MNKLCCIITMFFTCGVCKGQNLVPNGDFEQYIGCPSSYAQFDSCLFWIDPYLYWQYGSPDYYNQCALDFSHVDVPNMTAGYQLAHSGGAFAGVFIWHQLSPNTREHIEIALTTTLTANACYHFEMYVNLANHVKFTTSDIGIYFSDTLITGIDSTQNYLFTSQINNQAGSYFDTLNWTLVSGNYIASGGENYLMIGNFKNNANSNVAIVNNSSSFPFAYVYIDDVSLSPCTSIGEQNVTEFIIYPNPFTEKISCRISNGESMEIILYDLFSRRILHQTFTNSVSLNTEQLAKGIYIYEVRNNSDVIKKGKVVKD